MKPPVFSCLDSRVTNNGSLYSRFLLGPFPIDLSLTVATTLRRSLLHSQATFAIASAQIEGAVHEYASLPGVQESVLELLLNLGEVVLTTTHRNLLDPTFRNLGNTGVYIASLKISGPGVVTAKEIQWPTGVYCVNPDTHIATLSNNKTLVMRIKIASVFKENSRTVPLFFSKNSRPPIEETTKVEFRQEGEKVLFDQKLGNRDLSKPPSLDTEIEGFVEPGPNRVGPTTLQLKNQQVLSNNTARNILPLEETGYETLPAIKEGKKDISEQNRQNPAVTGTSFVRGLKPLPQEGVELAVSSCSYPVEKVNFVIERDDQWEGYRHRIILEVWTNGSISPRQAIFNAIGWVIRLVYTLREPAGFIEPNPLGEH